MSYVAGTVNELKSNWPEDARLTKISIYIIDQCFYISTANDIVTVHTGISHVSTTGGGSFVTSIVERRSAKDAPATTSFQKNLSKSFLA